MTGNNVWIPWESEKRDSEACVTIFTNKRDLTDGELRKGLALVAKEHAYWLEKSPQSLRKMYNVVYDNGEPEEDGVVVRHIISSLLQRLTHPFTGSDSQEVEAIMCIKVGVFGVSVRFRDPQT